MIAALLRKELVLSAHVITYCFIAFGLMTLLPGYPILCGAFFVTLGIYQSFQAAREANDIVFSALLPVAKSDIVKGKFMFVLFIELAAFLIMAILTLVRMTVLSEAAVYRANVLMNANLFFLGLALTIFGAFNFVFVYGYFRTAYKFGRPFVFYIIVCFIIIGVGEALHHVPGLAFVNAFGFDCIGIQVGLLVAGLCCFALLTYSAYRASCKAFDRIDL